MTEGGVGVNLTSGIMSMKSCVHTDIGFWTLGTHEEMLASVNPGRLEVSVKFSMHSSTCGLC